LADISCNENGAQRLETGDQSRRKASLGEQAKFRESGGAKKAGSRGQIARGRIEGNETP